MNENPIPEYHPLIVAWKAYKNSAEYAAVRSWAMHEAHSDGSLWDAFAAGWMAVRTIQSDSVKDLD